MKKLILFVFVLAVLAACNNEAKQQSANDSLSAASSAKDDPSTGAPQNGDCSGLLLFKKGTVIEAVSYNKDGAETSRQVSTVLNVSPVANGMKSEVEMKNTGQGKEEKVFTGTYNCDGKNIYVDLTSLFASMDAGGATITGDPVIFPINISEGQTLPDANYSMTVNKGGKQIKTTVYMKERKVGAKEKITTPAGTFDCFKISAVSTADVDVEGMDGKMKKMMETMKSSIPKQSFVMYYDPAATIVKVEMYSDDKLVSHSDVVAIK